MEGVLQSILDGRKETNKKIEKGNGLLAQILHVQSEILDIEIENQKQEARDRQASKRKAADTQTKAPSSALRKEKEEKKKNGIFENLLKSLGTCFWFSISISRISNSACAR